MIRGTFHKKNLLTQIDLMLNWSIHDLRLQVLFNYQDFCEQLLLYYDNYTTHRLRLNIKLFHHSVTETV